MVKRRKEAKRRPDMLIFPKEKIVYFAVPKTGSTSIQRAFGARAGIRIDEPPSAKHCTPRAFRVNVEAAFGLPPLKNLESVAVVRDPFERLSSWYRYRQRDGMRNPANSTRDIDFERFVHENMEENPPSRARVGLQSSFLSTRDGRQMLVKHLFALPRLHELQDWLNDRLGTNVRIQQYNVSDPMDLRLSASTRQAYRDHVPKEFELWHRVYGQG